MFERLEKIFREMNRALRLDGVIRAALLGLEDVLVGVRARIVPQSYDLIHRLGLCGLESRFILIDEDHHDILRRVQISGQTQVDLNGIDPTHIHCCIVPFLGGLIYLDAKDPLTSEIAAVAGMVTQQLVANMNGSMFGMVKSQRDLLNDLPNESWIHNQLHQYEGFSVLSFELDGFEEFKTQWGWQTGDAALRELVAFINQRLSSDDILARSQGAEFLVLTKLTEKGPQAEFWKQALKDFEAIGVANQYNLTLSAGLAIFPEDGGRHDVLRLAQMACARAGKMGDRILAVASPTLSDISSEGDPRSRFDPRCSAIVTAAVQECQLRQRPIDPLALLWGLSQKEADLSQLLWDCGLNRTDFRETLESQKGEGVEFSKATLVAFSSSLEFAHRCGKKTVGVEHLLLACLSEPNTEKLLRDCGLEYGRLLTGLYRAGSFVSSETFLVGDFGIRPSPRPEVKSLPKRDPAKRAPAKLLQSSFGDNFTAEVWGLLAAARTEAQRARHDLGFVHLYLATLLADGLLVSVGRRALKLLKLDDVSPEDSVTGPEVLQFFQKLEWDYPELTAEILQDCLRKHPDVLRFIVLMECMDD